MAFLLLLSLSILSLFTAHLLFLTTETHFTFSSPTSQASPWTTHQLLASAHLDTVWTTYGSDTTSLANNRKTLKRTNGLPHLNLVAPRQPHPGQIGLHTRSSLLVTALRPSRLPPTTLLFFGGASQQRKRSHQVLAFSCAYWIGYGGIYSTGKHSCQK